MAIKQPAAVLLAALALGIPGVAAASPAPLVRTAQGLAAGTASRGVEAWLGLPYAQGPVGALRWQAPRPAPAWQGVRDASRFGPSCYQAQAGAWGPYTAEFLAPPPYSEDCLTANVWKPAGPAHGLPVLVFIHGGGFSGGGATVPVYDGAALAARRAVVVTIQYRVGVFGFLAHPALRGPGQSGASGNYGLEDQIAALRWIKANIARFGGDPANVTIAGESAGAESVVALIVSPRAKGLFAKAMALSGASMAVDVPSLAQGDAEGQALGARLHAADAAALRAVAAADLVEATKVVPGGSGPPRLVYVPHVDGAFLPHDPVRAALPVASPVPLLTGFNGAEMIDLSIRSPAAFEAAVRGRYGDFADRLLALYPHADAAQAQQSNLLIARDRYMTGLLLWARARAQAGQRVYAYLYDHAYPPAPGGASFGAFHSSQLPYLFGTLGQGGRQFTARDAAVSRQWQDHVLAFLRSGNPAGRGAPWPTMAADGSGAVMWLGDKPGLAPAVSTPARQAAFAAYAAAGGNLGLM
ncbi:carboxylesterase family protein [Novosphingobium sp. SG720]|uniref:carboxylesterase/lipase family protein n=1 Tax=Novosphingobium sp. SG720 TaxID=2586998 RepID=UPI00144507A2|nr:carboxylesterase family protein [Novosphingobium sp. SG720]NKJ44154.1 para-nitrobenzyl esterase [Novosphingobium sp. SG720]